MEKAGHIEAFASESQNQARAAGEAARPIKDAFTTPALQKALDSPLASRQTRERVLLTAANDSVGPISALTR